MNDALRCAPDPQARMAQSVRGVGVMWVGEKSVLEAPVHAVEALVLTNDPIQTSDSAFSHTCIPLHGHTGLNKYSSRITQPKSQGASQAMLYATGLKEEDMNKPQVRWALSSYSNAWKAATASRCEDDANHVADVH